MRKNTKRGFTLVELVIVIAVIAVLSAIIIPVTSSVVQNAKETVDKTTVKALNDALAQDESKNGKRTLYSDVINAMENYGYGVDKLTPLSSGDILWDSVNNTFVLYKDGKEVFRQKGSSRDVKDTELWKVANSDADIKNNSYSVYLAKNFAQNGITVTSGVDVGENNVNVDYKNQTGTAQNVIIRTNGGKLAVDAPNDTVNHYGTAGYVEIKAVANESYHEFGEVNLASIETGRFVAESTALVVRVHVAGNGAILKEENGANVWDYTKTSGVSISSVENKKDAEIKESSAISADEAKEAENTNVTKEGGVAEINGLQFADLQSAFNNAKNGDTVKVLENIDIKSAVYLLNKTITLDANGKTLYNSQYIWETPINSWSLISVREGANLTITGNGEFLAKKDDCYAVDLMDGGKCTIENGTFSGNIHAVYCLLGELTVKGGKFDVQQKYHVKGKENEFVLNCNDTNRKAGTAKITVMGGMFELFNPADCWAEGEHTTFLAEGYISTQKEVIYPDNGKHTFYEVTKAN